jgi:hypothetical protein
MTAHSGTFGTSVSPLPAPALLTVPCLLCMCVLCPVMRHVCYCLDSGLLSAFPPSLSLRQFLSHMPPFCCLFTRWGLLQGPGSVPCYSTVSYSTGNLAFLGRYLGCSHHTRNSCTNTPYTHLSPSPISTSYPSSSQPRPRGGVARPEPPRGQPSPATANKPPEQSKPDCVSKRASQKLVGRMSHASGQKRVFLLPFARG